jgi:hypothetical protein
MRQLWKADAPLTAVSLLMLVVLAACGVGLLVDPRVIAGAPAWLKPAKFAASIAIYGFTVTWFLSYLQDWPRTRRIAGWTMAIVSVIEMGTISMQAWRGTTSHFNIGTTFDRTIFAVMGMAILVLWVASIAVAVALWRQRFADAALGWALRFAMIIAVAGAGMGGLMTRPTEAQLAAARATHHIETVGAHTVGGPDGGPGLPGTTWSTAHGDLRIPHFLGLHAMQVLPLVSIVLARTRRRTSADERARLVRVAAASYAALTAILLWQALRGQSIVAPDAVTLAALAAWLLATIAAGAGRIRRAVTSAALTPLVID